MIKRTTLIYLTLGLTMFTGMMLYGKATVFQWSMFVTVVVHLFLLWWRGYLVDQSHIEIKRLREEFEEYKRHMEKKVDQLANRPIFLWNAHDEKHQRA